MNKKNTHAIPCGFCSTGNHERCPGGVRNGGGSIALCTCDCEKAGKPRCTECNHRDPQDISENWRCIDPNACEARIVKVQQNNPLLIQIREIREASEKSAREAKEAARDARRAPEDPDAPSRPSRGPRKTSGECGCCGEPTKGGKFLPGHDSKYLNSLVDHYKGGSEFVTDVDVDAIRAKAYAVSPAFGGKFDKRVGFKA